MLIDSKEIKLRDGSPIVLRSPKPSEAGALLSHLKVVFGESYRNMNYPANHFDNFPEEQEAKILSDFAKSPNGFMLSAFVADRIVGNLGCFGSTGEFLKHSAKIGMGIEKQFCGIGLGSGMLKYAVEAAAKAGFHRLELNVRTFNEAGIRLYEGCGFERTGHLKEIARIDGEFFDEYSYQLILNKS